MHLIMILMVSVFPISLYCQHSCEGSLIVPLSADFMQANLYDNQINLVMTSSTMESDRLITTISNFVYQNTQFR
jgi:hypothetical protein